MNFAIVLWIPQDRSPERSLEELNLLDETRSVGSDPFTALPTAAVIAGCSPSYAYERWNRRGRLAIETTPGSGALVRVVVPILERQNGG